MNKYCLTLILCFFSYFSQAMDIRDGDFIPSDRVKKIVRKDPLNAFTYQLLRQSEKNLKGEFKGHIENPVQLLKKKSLLQQTVILGENLFTSKLSVVMIEQIMV